jgi:hypothetical protein
MQVLKYSRDFNLGDYSSSRLHGALSPAATGVVLCLPLHVLAIGHDCFLTICHYDKNIVITENE